MTFLKSWPFILSTCSCCRVFSRPWPGYTMLRKVDVAVTKGGTSFATSKVLCKPFAPQTAANSTLMATVLLRSALRANLLLRTTVMLLARPLCRASSVGAVHGH